MAFAVVLCFDAATDKKISAFQDKLLKTGIESKKVKSTLRPHITLGIFEEISCADCECKINEIAFDHHLETVAFSSLGVFVYPEKVFFLSPVPSVSLLTIHKKIHDELGTVTSGSWEIYEPGRWVPHCTLANDLDMNDLNQAISNSEGLIFPFQAIVSQIGVVEFDPEKVVFQVDIKHND